MELSFNPTNRISYTGDRENKLKESVRDNSTGMTVYGGAATAGFTAANRSAQIGNRLVKAVRGAKNIKIQRQEQILSLISKCKPLARFANNPIVKGAAGVLAGFAAVTTFIGSTVKIADTYGFLTDQNPAA